MNDKYYKISIKRLTFWKQNEIMNTNSEFKEDIEYVNKSLLSN